MIRVLVVDDHTVVREGLKRIIKDAAGMTVAGEASDGEDALRLIRFKSKVWDVVLLDVTLPGRSGIEILRDIKKERALLPVLILSMHGEDQYAVRALKAGAAGYLTKESAPDQLVEAIRKVAVGARYISASVAEQLALDVSRVTDKLPHTILSDREYEVLRLIASGLTVSQIGKKLSLSVKTISTYRARVLEKMGMENNAQLTHYAVTHQLTS